MKLPLQTLATFIAAIIPWQVQRKVDLASTQSFIKFVMGRPHIFARDGGGYLLARNFMPDIIRLEFDWEEVR